MYDYMIGKITNVNLNTITLECNNIGYIIKTTKSNQLVVNQEVKIYIYQYIKENLNELYGFITYESRELFISLLSVKGLGCKSVLSILDFYNPNDIIEAIQKSNKHFFQKVPGIGLKTSEQIILDLKYHFSKLDKNENNNLLNDIIIALKSIGFKQSEIDDGLRNIDLNKFNDTNLLLKEVLKNLKKEA